MKKEKFIVENEIKLLDFISGKKSDLSNKKIKQYIKYNSVLVNDKVTNNCNFLLKKNDSVVICYGNKVIQGFDIDIIYEDKDIIVINKPSGLLSISNDKEKDVTAFKMVREHVRKNSPKTFLFVIHRLDQETSGVLMFAKNEKVKHLFQDNWNEIVKKRKYIAQVEGIISGSGVIKSYLKESKTGVIYSSKNKDGKYAVTEYNALKKGKNKTLLDVNILTGRRNQIRVHLSESGHPIIGDKKYGSKIKSRLMLHAYELELVDPRNNNVLTFSTSISDEFYKL